MSARTSILRTDQNEVHWGDRLTRPVAAVTNDIFTREDQEFLIRNEALPKERIRAIETGGCPHAAIREDISANLGALEELQAVFDTEMLFVESGGDNLAGGFPTPGEPSRSSR